MSSRHRLVVVSNRLPITVGRHNGMPTIQQSGGGLVSALLPILKRTGGCWVGWTGSDYDDVLNRIVKSGHENYSFEPVFLTPNEKSAYYDGFSNEIMWPLCHGLPSRCRFSSAYWVGYRDANNKFADAVVCVAQGHDFIWVHDYHLLMLAAALRSRGLEQRLGYFHHIPFPPPDVFAALPWRDHILNGLIQFDSIGFQTENDQYNFVACLKRCVPSVRISHIAKGVLVRSGGHYAKVGTYPISVDYATWVDDSSQASVHTNCEAVRTSLNGTRILVGVDRLDYTKGILERLTSFQTLLAGNPDLRGRVTLLQFVVPSRENIPEYTDLKLRIEMLVSKINGEYGIPGWVPVQYFYRSVPRNELLAYYRAADIALVTPLRDGMNLVAKEFCASRTDSQGVLILSEFAGAAEELKCGALLVNPHDTNLVASVIRDALEMSKQEQRARMDAMRSQIRSHNVFDWAHSFKIYDADWMNSPIDPPSELLQLACS